MINTGAGTDHDCSLDDIADLLDLADDGVAVVWPADCEMGSIGFRGPPDSEGDVEVAYAIEEAHQMWLPFVGEVTDRDDGQVWRWERMVAPNE